MSILRNLAYIQNAVYYPCAKPDPYLIIKAAGSAAFPVLLSAVSFGCLDIVKMRAGISPWHARGMRALIEGAIPPAQSDQVNKIYKFFIPLEKALFFFFVVDLTVDFVARWQSQIFKLGACGEQSHYCSKDGDTPVWFNTPTPQWAPIQYHTTHEEGQCAGGNINPIIVPAGQFFSCSFSLKIRQPPHARPATTVSTRLQQTFPVFRNFKPQVTPAPWLGNTIHAQYYTQGKNQFEHDAVYTMQAMADEPAVSDGGSAHVQFSEFPIGENSILPVNCFGAPA